jgi:hypothetical protein
MKYYITRTCLNQPKNKAQEHIQAYLERYFNMLVKSDDDLNSLIGQVKKEVEETNRRYPRCKPMETSIQNYKQSDSVDIFIHAGIDRSFASLTACKIYSEYDEGFVQYCL